MKATATLGGKHTCSNCNAKYYDMGKLPAACPRCDNVREVLTKAIARQKKKNAEKASLEASKSDITWGSQIRSYVLDDARIKDLRTGVETGNTQAVLDGDLDRFIVACLKQQSE